MPNTRHKSVFHLIMDKRANFSKNEVFAGVHLLLGQTLKCNSGRYMAYEFVIKMNKLLNLVNNE